jgi:predicted PurR-regulated permease PerM
VKLRRPTARLRRALKVNPLVTILSVLVGASLLGVLGALLALPVAAAIQSVLRDWWASRGEDSPATGHPSP